MTTSEDKFEKHMERYATYTAANKNAIRGIAKAAYEEGYAQAIADSAEVEADAKVMAEIILGMHNNPSVTEVGEYTTVTYGKDCTCNACEVARRYITK